MRNFPPTLFFLVVCGFLGVNCVFGDISREGRGASGLNITSKEIAFEAAFQGECREDGPCQQLCFDLHDGTFECGCRDGYTLISDGYSCLETSEYEMLQNLNLTLPSIANFRDQIYRYMTKATRNLRSKYGGDDPHDPRARTLSQSDDKSWSKGSEDAQTYFSDPYPTFSHRDQLSPNDKLDKLKEGASTFPSSGIDSTGVFEPLLSISTTIPSVGDSSLSCAEVECLHGGNCLQPGALRTEFRCRCPLGWKGTFCQNAEMFQFPRFRSFSFLTLRMKMDEISQSLKLELEFRPELYEGVILFIGDPRKRNNESPFCCLVLRNGILEFRYFGGVHVGIVRSEQAITLNSWNRATLLIDEEKVWLQLNDGPLTAKNSEGVFPSIGSKHVVCLGGFPNISLLALTTESPVGFQGCLRHLAINSYSYSLQSTLKSDILDGADIEECRPWVCNTVSCMNGGQCVAVKPNWGTCLCPLGFGGDHCEDTVEVVVPSFDGTSHLQFPGLASTSLTYTEILVVFLPHSPDGALLYNGYRINGSGDFLSLNLNGGFVELRFDLGTGVNRIRSVSPIVLHMWHTVLITRTGRLATMRVDVQAPVNCVSEGGYSQLSLPLNLYLGGAPNIKELSASAEIIKSFIGCVQKLVINGKSVKLVDQALSGININNCQHPCVQRPCAHGGTCEPSVDSYNCHCLVGYTGPNCQTEIIDMVSRPMFVGNSYLHYINEAIFSRLRGQSLHMLLTFRALAPFGLILWAGSREVLTSSDYLALGLHNGYLRLEYNLGSGPIALLCNYTRVDDGSWHTLNFIRFKQRGSITLDSKHTISAVSPGPLKELNIKSELYLGGMPDIIHHSAGLYTVGFVGCLSSLTLNSDYHLQFLTMAMTGINIQPCV